jgi:dTDP-4-amino-4,6-dideoxygalactose transaminase
MNIPFLDLKKNYKNISNEINYEINNLFNNCDFILGENVKLFENKFAQYLNIKHFIGCANGTDALEISIKSLDLKENDEIIVQGNTYIATSLGVVNNNIKLVLCDIDENTHMINIEKMKEKINNNTKAIIIVHLYGFVPNMDEIIEICNINKLYLIEDCAQAHGALWKNKKVIQ